MPYAFADPYGQSGLTQSRLQDALTQRSQNAYQQAQNLDLDTDEGQNAFQRLLATGAINPSAGADIVRSQKLVKSLQNGGNGRSSRTSPFSDEGTQFLANFHSLDPRDPEYFTNVRSLIQQNPNAFNDPRVVSAVGSAQQHALSFHPKVQADQTDWRNTINPRFVTGAQKAISDLANFSTAIGSEDTAEQATKNRLGVQSAIRRLGGMGLSAEDIQGELLNAGLEPADWFGNQGPHGSYLPSQPEKEAYLTAQGIDPKKATPEQWRQADYGALKLKAPAISRQVSGMPVQTPTAQPTVPSLQGDEFTAGQTTPVASPVVSDAHVEPEWDASQAPGLGNVQQQVAKANEAKAAQEAQKQQDLSAAVPQWEKLKQDFWGQIPKDQIDRIRLGIPINSRSILQGMGMKPDEVAFHKEGNRPVTWQQVADEAMKDSRFKQALGQGATAPVQTLPSGRKFTVGAPIPTK
jgi:hypothetical protein